MKLDNISLKQLQYYEYQLYTLLVRAKRDKNITADGVRRLGLYLDDLLETNKFTLCISYEFTYFQEIEEVIKVLKYFYQVIVNGVKTKRLVNQGREEDYLIYC